MNLDILKEYIAAEGVPSGSLAAVYSFASGGVDYSTFPTDEQLNFVFNKIYSTGQHFAGGQLVEGRLPGLSVGYSNSPASGISGSGYFQRRELIKVGSKIPYDDWTMFLDFGEDICITGKQINNKPEIILSSMDNPDALSGFCVGINDANRLFIEHLDSNERKVNTLNRELSRFNVISASFNKTLNRFSLTYHDYTSAVNETLSFYVDDYNHGNEWHIGGMPNASGNYTGYSGYIDDFVLFDTTVSESSRNTLSEAFFVKEIVPESVQLTTGLVAFPGTPTLTTGVVGSAVTGHLTGLSSAVSSKGGDSGNLYTVFELTGALTGELIEIGTGTGSGIGSVTVTVPKHNIYYTGELEKHAKNFMQFKEELDDDDVYEAYLFKTKKDNLSIKLDFSDMQSLGFLDENYIVNSNVNLFLNGGGQISGIDYFLDGSYVQSEDYYNSYDLITYDKIDGEFIEADFTGAASNVDFSGSKYVDKNVYLNGQKLISGLDYVTFPPEEWDPEEAKVRIYPTQPSGNILFEPMATGRDSIMTGNSSERIEVNSVQEQIWLNGLKQVENLDYFKVNECSLIDFNKNIPNFSNSIYNNEGTYFNI